MRRYSPPRPMRVSIFLAREIFACRVPLERRFAAILKRDLKLALRAGGGAGIGVYFFLAVVVIVPFAVGPDLPLQTHRRRGAVDRALLASLLGLERIFAADHEDGSLDLFFRPRARWRSPPPREGVRALDRHRPAARRWRRSSA